MRRRGALEWRLEHPFHFPREKEGRCVCCEGWWGGGAGGVTCSIEDYILIWKAL